MALAAVILAALIWRSFNQVGYWRDSTSLARHVLVHRVITNFRAESEGLTSATLVDRLLETVKA